MLSIGNLGKQVGLPTKTIRFYEEIGLISKARRAENGYRVYSEKAIEELTLIKHARDLGLPIPEIRKLMIGCENGDCTHKREYVEKEIGDYITKLDEKIEQLQTLSTQLKSLKNNLVLNTANCDNKTYCCNILSQIESLPKGGEK